MGADYKIKKHYTCMTKLILFKVKINLIAFLSIFQILFWNRLAGSISFARAWPEEIRFRCTSLMDDVGVAHCWRCWEYCLESELKVKGNPYYNHVSNYYIIVSNFDTLTQSTRCHW